MLPPRGGPARIAKAEMLSMVIEQVRKGVPPAYRSRKPVGGAIVGGIKVRRQDRVEEAVMDTVGPWELLIIVAVLVALFGANRLPKMARSLGEGIREFRSAFREGSDPAANGPAGQAQQTSTPTEQQHAQSQ
jgi:sec-independent protein translocase protein TatA